MKFREFGNTGEKVSALGFGLMRLPVVGKDRAKIDEEPAAEMFRYALDRGVNYFDTAFPYHTMDFSKPGASEPFLGNMIEGLDRKDIYLASKLPSWIVTSREDMDRLLDLQLERMKTDYLDFYMLHGLNRKFWAHLKEHDSLDFLEQALKSGKIRYAGFSFHDDLSVFKEITDAFPWDFTQIQYNWFDENFQAGREGLDHAAGKGMAVVVMEPLRGGALVNRLPFEVRQLFKNTGNNWSYAEWALRWVWGHPGVATVLSGMSDMAQVEENVRLAAEISDIPLNKEQKQTYDEAKELMKELEKVPCTTCGYCMPCPEGVDIPRNFALYNDHNMFRDPAAVMRYNTFLGPKEKSSNCIECGICLEKCPQQIQIPQELKNVNGLFGQTGAE